MIEKLNKILEIMKEIADESPEIGDILISNFKFSLDSIDAIGKGEKLDVSEKLELVCKLTGIDLELLVKSIIESSSSFNESETDKETIDFIINNSKDIDDYEKFLKEASSDIEFLKANI